MTQTASIDVQKRGWPQKVTTSSETQLATLGERFRTKNAEFEYILYDEGAGSVAGLAGMLVSYSDKDPEAATVTPDISDAGAKAAVPAGFLMCAMSDGEYGWILKEGYLELNSDITVTAAASNTTNATEVAIAVGDRVMPSVSVDGGLAKFLSENDADDAAETEEALVNMCENIWRIVGIVTDVTASAMRIKAKFPF